MTAVVAGRQTAHRITGDAEAIAVSGTLGESFARADAERDTRRILGFDQIAQLQASGLLGITVPRSHGGADVTARTLGEVFTELSTGDSSLGQIPQNHFFFVDILRHTATPAQREFFFRGAARRAAARPWWEAEVERAADEPGVIDAFGELALRVRGARALVRAAGEALDEARADLTEQSSAEASVAVAAARAAADTAAVTVASGIYALIGTRAAATGLDLDRHWRNARTHTLHDPRRWKIRHIGQWELIDIAPPRNGIV